MLCECGCGKETNTATKTDKSKGWVKGEPHRFLRGHAVSGKFLNTINEPIWKHRLTPYELGWFVGIYEGEGTLSLSKYKRKTKISLVPAFRITSTDQSTVKELHRIIPEANICVSNRLTEGEKQVFIWTLAKRSYVIDLGITIRNLVGERRRSKIDEMLGMEPSI